MRHYSKDVTIAAPAAVVYRAITSPEGLRGWWTTTCEVGTGVGAQSIFRFGQTHNVMRVVSLQPDAEVRWECVEQHHHASGQLTRTDEWAGTSVVFRLVAVSPSTTLLHVEHIGLVPELECYDICNTGWNHFLGTSLKGFVETGKGSPFVGPTA
jgi:uncharacterized protein YndB with AHSA1/START domain